MRVMLVDDHAAVRAGYRRLLGSEPGIDVCNEACDADEAYARLQAAEAAHALPAVLLLDLSLGGRSGLDLLVRCRQRFPDLRVVVSSMHGHPALVDRCLNAGAQGYVSKSSPPEVLLDAVAAVGQGRTFVDPALSQARDEHSAMTDAIGSLSDRELEVVVSIARGVPAADVARSLNLSTKTVANHLSAARQKLGAQNDFQLMGKLSQLGLLDESTSP